MSAEIRLGNIRERVAAAAVSEMGGTRRTRSKGHTAHEKVREYAAEQAHNPRQVRNILKSDMKQARHAAIQEGGPRVGAKRFNQNFREDRHRACGTARGNKAVRFLTSGSRNIESDVLPGCYMDPKGLKPGTKSTRCPCGGSYTSNRARHYRSKKHQRWASQGGRDEQEGGSIDSLSTERLYQLIKQSLESQALPQQTKMRLLSYIEFHRRNRNALLYFVNSYNINLSPGAA